MVASAVLVDYVSIIFALVRAVSRRGLADVELDVTLTRCGIKVHLVHLALLSVLPAVI